MDFERRPSLTSQVTILTVLDNFVAMRADRDYSRMSGRDLYELGDRVREFSESFTPTLDETKHPIYLGGWPSANFLFIDGEMSMTALLYAGQLLVRDQISDWFSQEQYRNEHMMSSPSGYWSQHGSIEEHNRSTRAFLATAIPALEEMRPLIEAGIVVPVPSEKLIWERRREIGQLEQQLTQALLQNVPEYIKDFSPVEIAADNSQRGMFAFAPGPEKFPQIRRSLAHGIRYFTREYLFASVQGATYTAPFRHEYQLCHQGLGNLLSPADRVVHAVLQSRVSAFSGLTPALIQSIHDDDNFAQFRQDLNHTYSNTPFGDPPEVVSAYLRDQENDILLPRLEAAQNSANDGLLSKLGIMLSRTKFTIGAALASGIIEKSIEPAAAFAVAGAALDAFQAIRSPGQAGPQQIWSALVGHQVSAEEEISRSARSNGPATISGWEIPPEPAMSIAVSPGQLISHDPRPPHESALATGTRYTVYDPCRCGSGRKFKFCCYGIVPLHPFASTR